MEALERGEPGKQRRSRQCQESSSTPVIMPGMHELRLPERVFQDPGEDDDLMEAQFIWSEEEEEEEEQIEEEEQMEEEEQGANLKTMASAGKMKCQAPRMTMNMPGPHSKMHYG
ncbi:hypothetical protein ABFV05_020220 [Capra hircus]